MNESRIPNKSKTSASKSSKPQKRLNEKELGTLYAYCETPLTLHTMLEKDFPRPHKDQPFDINDHVAILHDSLSTQGPDDALLSLALMGWIIEDHAEFYYNAQGDGAIGGGNPAFDKTLKPLLTELKYEAENVIHDLGRLRIDLDAYRAEISEQEIFAHLKGVPDTLCVFTSLFQELHDAMHEASMKELSQLCRYLAYQSESQADYARGYISSMMKPGEEAGTKAPMQNIPLPFDLQPDPSQDGKIVDFSLFTRK